MQAVMRLATGLAMLTAFAGAASAQISMSSAVDLALRNDPRVKSAQAEVVKARADLASTHDAYIPTVGISGGYGASAGVPLSVPVVFSIASQSLLFNFSQKDYVRAASSALKAAELAYKEARDKVAEDAVVTYLDLDNAQQQHEAMLDESTAANRLVAIVQDRQTAGQDTRIDLLHAQRTAGQIRIQQLQLEDEMATLQDHLGHLLGLPGTSLQTISNSIPELPAPSSMTSDSSDSFAIQSAFAGARSKQETAFGTGRYRFRPELSFGANYSRISTSHTNYPLYYPGFQGGEHLSDNALSIGIQIQIPIFDRGHQDRARSAEADAIHSLFDAEDQRNQFLEERFKLRHSIEELSARSDLAEIDRDLAQEQLNAVLVQLQAESANATGPQLSPKDEQNARLQQSARTIDLLNAQYEVRQAQVNLMRQTGMLDGWLKSALTAPAAAAPTVQTAPPPTP
jgi:outer membrane protein TolC